MIGSPRFIDNWALKLFECYVARRLQKVNLNNLQGAAMLEIKGGVAQGTILGPVLLIFINCIIHDP